MSSSTIKCPKCQAEIPVEEALGHSIQEKLEKEFEQKFSLREKELAKKIKDEAGDELKLLQDELTKKEKKLEESRENELELRQQKNDLEEQKRNFELDKQR